MERPENDADKPEKERQLVLTPAKDQPSPLIEDEEDRRWAKTCAGGMVWNADEGTLAVIEAVLLPNGLELPPWLDDTGMKLIGLLKERADKYIQAQRKARTTKKNRLVRKGLRLVHG